MAAAPTTRWDELDSATRRTLEGQYLSELEDWAHAGLTPDGVEAYLDYRRERPFRAVTTYEEGQIERLLRRFIDPAEVPDPVEQEEHVGWLEQFGARRLHMTNSRTYLAVMVGLTYLFVLALIGFVLWL